MTTGKRKRKAKGKLYGRVKPDNPAHYKRFVEPTKTLGVDESGEAFKKPLDNIVLKKDGNN